MSNPIDNGPRLTGSTITGTGRGAKARGPATTDGGADKASGEQGDRSVASSRLQAVRDRIDNTPSVDRERVESIKQRIASGEYAVDPQRVASKFAELEGLLSD